MGQQPNFGDVEHQPLSSEKTPLMDNVSPLFQRSFSVSEPPELPEIDTDQPVSPEEFRKIIKEVRHAISVGVLPQMISQGSSGSYFCRDRHGKIVGVFKPKNEEPYGKLNPKWTKWLHRTCCPCCFGRGCLIPNSGYISEASASLVDQKLELNIVPRTEIISFASPSFAYPFFTRRRRPLPEKIGSFQVFVRGYKDATICIQEFQDEPLTDDLKRQFRMEFERLVMLDYITRNTDRGNDNWLIKIDTPREVTTDDWQSVSQPVLKVAAIDNGLSFPFKHPDSWRTYPFGWALLPAAQVPFSEETKNLFLPKLIDPEFIEDLIKDLRKIAQIDGGYSERLFLKQMSVLRGQVFNLAQALLKNKTPFELTRFPPLTISHVDPNSGFRRRMMGVNFAVPLFSKC